MVGLARIARQDQNIGVNSAFFIAYREKPEARYGLAIATLYGRAMGEHVCTSIFQSFWRGSLNQSRIVRSRDWDTFGVGDGYDGQDFGLVSFWASFLEIEAGPGATLEEFQANLFGTWPKRNGALRMPYLGLTYNRGSDLIYHAAAHELVDPEQTWYAVALGAKYRLFLSGKVRESHTFRNAGLGRLEASVRFNDEFQGVFLESTFWF